MIRIGMFVGDRYEILEQVGSGGMSDVYKGKDHKLNRFVAIKVLKKEFSNDKNFVAKFRIEAQSAAGLAHPNIVNVYDVGEEEGIHYIVMELVEGITLKNYIQKKGKLSVKEAISIAIQMSMGIEAAHNNHIIHRDIKPQNIIISRDGKVKVTDFGIARAASSNTISSNVMGSVHYTSPEQARGGYSDEKSDIYSLGITLYEMLTGRVPFDGDNTVAVAIKHIQEEMDSPRIYSPEVPVSLEQIVFKCTQKRADRRYSDMAAVVADLKKSLVSPDEDFVKLVPEENMAKTIMISDDDRVKMKSESGKAAYDLKQKKAPQVEEEEEEEDSLYDREEEEDEDESEDMNPTLERIMNVLGIIAAIIIACIALYIAAKALGVFNGFGSNTTKQENAVDKEEEEKTQVEMINVVGKTYDEAKKELNALGLGIKASSESSSLLESGYVIAQDVKEGKKVDKNTTINVTVSSGENSFSLEDVTGKTQEEATSILKEDGLSVEVTEEYSSSVEQGKVISTSPKAGTSVTKDTNVTIVVSKGEETKEVEVPDITEMSEAAAKSALKSAGLKVGKINTAYSAKIEEGYVVSQGYTAGKTVSAETEVDFVVSMGPETASQTSEYTGTIRIEKSDLPEGFTDGTMRLDLTQNGKTITVVEEDVSASEFPYSRQIIGESGVTTGTVKMYIDGVAVDGTFTITFSE
jgi:serine/threonine protein kinase/beta-lactam-binding protein with PASTA domain